MRAIALLLSLLFALPAAAQEWSAGVPPGEKSTESVAWIMNADGHILLLRGEDDDGQYWLFAELRLGGGESLGGDIPSHEFRAGYPIESEWQLDHEQYGRTWGRIEKSKASWVLATFPKEHFAHSGALYSWFTGREVAIIYLSAGGAEKTTRFPLAGLKTALSAATGWNLGP